MVFIYFLNRLMKKKELHKHFSKTDHKAGNSQFALHKMRTHHIKIHEGNLWECSQLFLIEISKK